MFIEPAYAVLCYTLAKRGLCRVCKRRKSTPFFTYEAFFVFLKLNSNKRSPTRKCWDVLGLYFTFSQHRLHWLGHILRMGGEQIPKSLLYSKLSMTFSENSKTREIKRKCRFARGYCTCIFWAQSRIADFGWHRTYYYIIRNLLSSPTLIRYITKKVL